MDGWGSPKSIDTMILERVAIRHRSGYNALACVGTYDHVDTSDKTDS